jgi:hypothetical protein
VEFALILDLSRGWGGAAMRKLRFGLSVIALMLVLISTQSVIAQNAKPLSNEDVVSMVKNLLPESVVLGAIRSNDTNFDVSPTGLIALKKGGVSAKVMEAMMTAANNKKASAGAALAASAPAVAGVAPAAAAFTNSPSSGAAPAGTPAGPPPAWQPTVSIPQGSSSVNLTAEATEIVQTKAKPTTLGSLAADQALNQALAVGAQAAQDAVMKSGSAIGNSAVSSGANILSGIMSRKPKQSKITYVWALTGGSSPANADGKRPTLVVNYAGIPGVKPEQFEPVIVKLSPTPQSTYRLVGATEAATTAEQSTQQDWPIYSSFVEDRIASTVKTNSPGHAQVTPSADLSAGRYAVALRPTDKNHKFSGEEVGKNQGEGLLFNYAWSFSVQ